MIRTFFEQRQPSIVLFLVAAFLFPATVYSLESARITYKSKKETMDLGGEPFVTVHTSEVRTIDKTGKRKRVEKTVRTESTSGANTTSRTTTVIRIVDSEKSVLLKPEKKVVYQFSHSPENEFDGAEIKPNEESFVREEVVAGKKCRVYKYNDSTVCIWNGLLLSQEYDIGNVVHMGRATKVETNLKIDPQLFEIPPDYQVITMGSPPTREAVEKAISEQN